MRIRLTNLPGISHGLSRTAQGAAAALVRYERSNSDIPSQPRRLLALAACGRYFGRRNLELALGSASLPQFPFRDWSWRWWNVLHFSGLDDEWEQFVRDTQLGGIRRAAATLRRRIAPDAYTLFLRRAGTNPHNDHRPKKGSIIWSKGGTWRIESSFTRLLVLKQHLPPRPHVRPWQQKLGPDGVRLVERELMNLINPDAMLVHEAKYRAVQYMRRRVAELLGRKGQMSPDAAAWFFQHPIPEKDGRWVDIDETGWYIHNRTPKHATSWEW